MILKKYYYYLYLLIIVPFIQTYSQSIGIVYEVSSFSINDIYNTGDYSPSRGVIKNIFLNYNGFLFASFQFSLKAGYGWNIHESHYDSRTDKSLYEDNTSGIPIECEVRYQHYIEKDSVFEPLIGIGLGYYNYTTKHKYTSPNPSYSYGIDYTTEGFGQYILFGMNIHISKKVTSSIQFKKIMTHSISTKYDSGDPENRSTHEEDIGQQSGFNNMAISLGIFYNL